MFTIRLRPGGRSAPPTSDEVQDAHDPDQAAQQADEVRDAGQADPRDLERLSEFASETGLTIIEIDLPQRRVVLWATAGTVSRAFRIAFAHYQYAGKVRRGQLGIIHLPRAIAEVVEEISGLDSGLPDWVSSAILSRGPEVAMRRQVVKSLLFVVVGGSLIAGGVFLYNGRVSEISSHLQTSKAGQTVAQRPTAVHSPSTPMSFPQGVVPSQPAAVGATLEELQRLELAAWDSLDAGRVRDAQDNFLKVLTLDPGRHGAMRGLVAVRRKIAADNPHVIRQQLAAYQDSINRGDAGMDGYSPAALKVLVSASLTAAQEIEAQSAPAIPAVPAPAQGTAPPGPPGPPALAADVGRSANGQPARSVTGAVAPAPPTPVPSRREPQRPAPQPPKAPTKPVDHPAAPPATQAQKPPVAVAPPKPAVQSAPTAQKPPVQSAPTPLPPPQPPRATTPASPQVVPPAPLRLYSVRIGPVADRDRATAISMQLSVGGFSQVQISTQTGYRVVSEPLPRKAAESLIATVAAQGLHSYAEPLRGDTVQLLFGTFTAQKDAETLAARIAAAGYDAWIREGVAYTLRLGPYPTASVSNITDIVKAVASEATVTTEPVP